MKRKKSLEDVEFSGKRVFVRVDFNVPIRAGTVADDTRIRASLPTLNYLLERGTTLILASHLGRPKGRTNPLLSLSPVAPVLQNLLGRPVTFVGDCVGEEVSGALADAPAGSVFLLENLRFHPGEEANDREFARRLGSLAEIYVNDAFGSAARAHASTVGMVATVPETCAGFLMNKELGHLGRLLDEPKPPFSVILGGAKISDKMSVVKNLLGIADNVLVGGGMAFTFLASQGYQIGDSICEKEKMPLAHEILKLAKLQSLPFHLPMDQVISKNIEKPVDVKMVPSDSIPEGWRGVDIGPGTLRQFQKILQGSKTIFWNGPMGVFEVEAFSGGTLGVALSIADSAATSVVGGGDSLAAVAKAGVAERITHLSTGGGASLDFLAGRPLPGVEALPEKES